MNDQELLAAYRATRWRVTLPTGETLLRLNRQAPPELRPGGIITGYNPASLRQDEQRNEAANTALRRALVAAGAMVFPTLSGEGEWREPGFAVCGLGREVLVRLGEQWGQNAVVWVDSAGTATLVVARSGFCGLESGEPIT